MAKKSAKQSAVVPPPSIPAAPVGAAVEIAGPRPADPRPASSGWVEPVGETVAVTVHTVRGLLPSRLPVFLATSALLVAGLIDPPVALGVGLGFEALRRWDPSTAR